MGNFPTPIIMDSGVQPTAHCSCAEAERDCGNLTVSIDRLGALASDHKRACDSGAAQMVIEGLELLLDRLIQEAKIVASPPQGEIRRRNEDETDAALISRNTKRMKGLLLASQSVYLCQHRPCINPTKHSSIRARSRCYCRIIQLPEFTAFVSYILRMDECYAKEAHFLRTTVSSWRVLSASFLKEGLSEKSCSSLSFSISQTTDFNSMTSLLSFRTILPYNSGIFSSIREGVMKSMLALLESRRLSLTDCGLEGRSLLCVCLQTTLIYPPAD